MPRLLAAGGRTAILAASWLGLIAGFTIPGPSGAAVKGTGDYPARPVRLIVPFPPGGGADFMGRVVAQGLTEKRGYTIVIDNRGGAGGIVGAETVAHAAPDGYTLVLANNSTHVMAVVLAAKPPYDPLRDFTPISMTTGAPQVLVATLTIPPRTVRELVAHAKANPGMRYASGGQGSQTHLAMELFMFNAGFKAMHVPYKGTGPGFVALMSGEAQLMFVSLPAAAPHVQGGRVRALGITGKKRSATQPAIPTIVESGVRGFEVNPWFGVLGPARLPAPLLDKLHTDIVVALTDDDARQRLAAQGAEVIGSTPEEFAAVIKQELQQWGRVVDKLGLRSTGTGK